jgi:hypothetical protein
MVMKNQGQFEYNAGCIFCIKMGNLKNFRKYNRINNRDAVSSSALKSCQT